MGKRINQRVGLMIAITGTLLGLVSQASAVLFSFETTEAVPSRSFTYNDTTGVLIGATSVPLTIQISGVNTAVASNLTFAATRVAVQSYLPPVGPSFDIWIFDGSFQFTTPGGILILSADFTGGRTITMSGMPLSGIQASSAGPGTLDYTAGPRFKEIAGSVLGFDPNDLTILLSFIDPQSMGFTLTGVLPVVSPSGFDADSSFSGNAEVAVTVVPEPATLALLGFGTLILISKKARREKEME